MVLFYADVLAAVEQKEFGLILYFGRVSDRVVAEGEALCALGEEQRVTEGAEAVANDSDVAMDRAVGVDNPVGGMRAMTGPAGPPLKAHSMKELFSMSTSLTGPDSYQPLAP